MKQKHFTVIVAGENHEELMKQYSNKIKTEPTVVMEFSKAKDYYDKEIKIYEEFLKTNNHDENFEDLIKFKLETLKETDYIDHYLSMCEKFGYTIDKETGNAISDKNPNGHYDFCRVGKDLSLPLINLNGDELFSCLKKDIDFSKIHKYNTIPYMVAWETVVDGREPKNDEERRIYENMKNRTMYFQNFKDKDTYVSWSTSFWGYAFVDQNGWYDIDSEKMNQIDWVNNFYEKFIHNLPQNTLITVYECVLE